MKIEAEFKKWFDSTNFKRLNMSSAEKAMLLLSFERGYDLGAGVEKYKLNLRDGK